MEIFQNFNKKFSILIFSMSAFLALENHVHSDSVNPKVKADGSGNFVNVWVQNNDIISALVGVYGAAADYPNLPIMFLYDSPAYTVGIPKLVTSSDAYPAGASAAVLFRAKDFDTGNFVILATTASTSGWSDSISVLSLNDGTESPHSDYDLAISSDGNTLIATWSAFLSDLNQTVTRTALSTDGGAHFNIIGS